ncbi:MAG: PilZ domain-containing protein [Fusobacteriaceae bacterium]|jgi:c-di-GMP-binding flagellar brake protein YcgR|nr:PilZ domain-containing protein [Fusobacteriaceae bacterium]MBN2838917.1 PilZ domain-containing protein [Fusobacteriaceae bacterium]
MDPKKVIELGTLVEIEVLNDEYDNQYFLTKISDVEEDFTCLDINLPMAGGQYVMARKNDFVRVSLKRIDGIYAFKSKVMYRALEPYAHIRLEFPEKLEKSQRREFFRVPVNLMVTTKKEVEELPKQAISIDLSGGGMCIVSRTNYEKDSEIILSFDLTNGTKVEEVKGVIKRKIEKEHYKIEYGIEFLDIDNKLRENLISYLFELQRTRKNK